MKTFVVILAVASLVSADIGLGYHYGPSKLQTSYATPTYSAAGGSGAFSGPYTGQNTASSVYKGQALQSSGSNSYQTSAGLQNGYPSQGLTAGTGYQGSGYQGSGYQGSGYQAGTGTGYQSGAGYQNGGGYQSGTGYQTAGTGGYHGTGTGYQTDSTKYQTGGNYAGASTSGSQYQTGGSIGTVGVSSGSLSGVQGLNQFHSANQYQSSAVNYQQYYNQVQQQPPQIFKHFYVHAAPEEPELPRVRQPVVLPAPQKHYKIIFIKTPAPAAGSAQFIPVQPQNEEKTIVYVLVKKQEAAEDIVVPPVEQKPPSKPEVFFIKYKGKEDSQAVINNIVNEYNSGKESVNVANAVYSAGTLDSISDVKYAAQSGGSSQSAGNIADAAQAFTGSSGSQYEASVSSVGQSLNSGSVDSGSSNSGFQSQSFGSSTVGYPSSTFGYQVSTGAPIQVSTSSGGYESSSNGFSSTASSAGGQGGYGQANTISSNQGIPHETYGTPKFRDN